jgi:transposase
MCGRTTGVCTRRDDSGYSGSCDSPVGLDGLHVVGVERNDAGLTVTVETASRPGGCPVCGVVAESHGRRRVKLVDTPCFGRLVKVVWLKRTCVEPDCGAHGFTETQPVQGSRGQAPRQPQRHGQTAAYGEN